MITPKELAIFEDDVLKTYEAVALEVSRFTVGMPEKSFRYKITNRIEELLVLCKNLEYHARPVERL